MKIGVLTTQPFGDLSFEETIDRLSEMGVEAVELSVGGYLGSPHLEPEVVADNEGERKRIRGMLDDRGLEISALSVHGNPIHPQQEIAEKHRNDFERAIRLADKMNVNVVVNFSGCPGASEKAKHPNWITFPWPDEHADVLEWQWEERIIPFWRSIAEIAEDRGIEIGIEMHPNMSVYNPESLLKLRKKTNDRIGANFDPSHLYWQGIEPTQAIRKLGEEDAIKHFHAKDTGIYGYNSRINGTLDTKPFTEVEDRSWIFRSVGYGHGEHHWKEIISALRLSGYDGVLSIEHEDPIASIDEGLEKAIDILKRAVLKEEPGSLSMV